MDALEKAYSEVASELGLGTEKLGVVMTIPEPIRNMKHDLDVNVYWGGNLTAGRWISAGQKTGSGL